LIYIQNSNLSRPKFCNIYVKKKKKTGEKLWFHSLSHYRFVSESKPVFLQSLKNSVGFIYSLTFSFYSVHLRLQNLLQN